MSNLKKNIFYNIIYQVLLLIIPLIVTPYISRVIGVEGVGVYSYTYSIIQYCVLFIMLGLNNYGNRTIAKNNHDKEKLSKNFWNIYYMQIICFLVVSIFFVIFFIFGVKEYRLIFLIEYIFIFSSAFDINWFFFGIEKFKKIVIRNLVFRAIALAAIFIFVKNSNDLVIYVLIMALANFFTNIILWPYIFKNLNFVSPNTKEIKKHFKKNIVLFIPVLAISVYNIMDKIMIGRFVGVQDVGLYESAEKIINIPLNIMTAVGTVMMPRISNLLSRKKEDKVKQLTRQTFIVLMFFAFPMMFGLFGIADSLVLLYLGDAFGGSIIFVKLLCIIIFFKILGNIVRTQLLIPYEKDGIYIRSVIGGAIINFILNIVLILSCGAIGAVIGTICAEAFVSFYQVFSIKEDINIKLALKEVSPFFFTSIIMFVVIMFIKLLGINNLFVICILQVVSGGLVYALLNIKYIMNNFVPILAKKIKKTR